MDELFHISSIDHAQLEAERDRVLASLRHAAPGAEIFEVGSTAVEGVIGKGDLDFLVRVNCTMFDAVRGQLDAILKRNPDQLSSEIYQGYCVESPLDVAVQLTVAGGPHDTFLAFLDALRADDQLVARYNDLKLAWHGRPMQAYRRAKEEFICSVLESTNRSYSEPNE